MAHLRRPRALLLARRPPPVTNKSVVLERFWDTYRFSLMLWLVTERRGECRTRRGTKAKGILKRNIPNINAEKKEKKLMERGLKSAVKGLRAGDVRDARLSGYRNWIAECDFASSFFLSLSLFHPLSFLLSSFRFLRISSCAYLVTVNVLTFRLSFGRVSALNIFAGFFIFVLWQSSRVFFLLIFPF